MLVKNRVKIVDIVSNIIEKHNSEQLIGEQMLNRRAHAIVIVLPLLLGAAIYGFPCMGDALPPGVWRAIRYYGADALWTISFMASMSLLWFNQPSPFSLIASLLALTVALSYELLQYSGVIPGQYCMIDLAVIGAVGASFVLVRGRRVASSIVFSRLRPVMSVLVSLLFILFGVASSAPNALVKEMVQEEVAKAKEEINEDLRAELLQIEEKINNLDVNQQQLGDDIEEKNRYLGYAKIILYVIGLITCLKLFGRPLRRVLAALLLRSFLFRPRHILDGVSP